MRGKPRRRGIRAEANASRCLKSSGLEFGQIFADPGEKGETGGIEHSMGNDRRPDGAVILDLEDLDASPVPVAIDNDDRAVHLARSAAVIAIAIQIDGESDPRIVIGIIDNPVAVDVDACLVAARHPVLCLRRQCESGVSTPLTQQPQHELAYPPRLH